MQRLFDELAERGTTLLRARAARETLATGLRRAWVTLPALPLAVLLLQGLRALAQAPPWAPGWFPLLVATLAVPAVPLLRSMWRARTRTVDRVSALGLLDEAAGAQERIVAADELIRLPEGSGFVEAALEDAGTWLGRARIAEPPPGPAPLRRTPIALLSGTLTVALLLGVLAAGGNPFLISAGQHLALQPEAVIAQRGAMREEPGADLWSPSPRDPKAVPGQDPRRGAAAAGGALRTPERSSGDQRPKPGRSQAGRSSDAATSRGAGAARGRPSQQGQTAQPPTRKKPGKATKKKSGQPRRESEEEEPSPGEESGATSGRGGSQGSDRNPVTSPWKSRDQVTTDEEEEPEDDEEVEDEEVGSEARGGVQPNLRDRKPPASRDLSIGFGNQPDPNANGRGGASQPKKSRGTASLVLGVPIPDRIKGQPNPGRTKVTQERVEPRRESAGPLPAQERRARTGPSGPLVQPRLTPWMLALVRAYFLSLHAEADPARETPPR